MATTSRADGTTVETIIASQDVTVPDPRHDDKTFGVQILAGQPVPPDLRDAYEHAVGGTGKARRAPEKDKAVRSPERSK